MFSRKFFKKPWYKNFVNSSCLTKIIFRQINSLVISSVKTLLSRYLCQICVGLNRISSLCTLWVYKNEKFTATQAFFRQINLEQSSVITVWKSAIKRDHDFYGKINIFSVKSTFLLKKLLNSWFHEKKFAWSRFVVLFHTVQKKLLKCENRECLFQFFAFYFSISIFEKIR